MLKKALVVILTLLTVLVLFSGCKYTAYKTYYGDISDYSEIWSLNGFFYEGYNSESSSFFPQKLDGLDVKDFYCRYDEQLPLGEGIQVFLHIKYKDDTSFNDESERLSTMSIDCNKYFEKTGLTAYATHIGVSGSSEYALVNPEKQEILYIYLKDLPTEEIEFDNAFLPKGYNYGDID